MTNLYIEEDQKFRIDSDIQVEKSFSLLKANAKVNPKDLTYTVFDERFATVEKDSNGNGIVTPKGDIYRYCNYSCQGQQFRLCSIHSFRNSS